MCWRDYGRVGGKLAIVRPSDADSYFYPPNSIERQNVVGEETVVLDEDFSKFDRGTEDAPDEYFTSDNQTGEILSKWTQAPGWTGAGIRQAGGTCAIDLVTYAGDEGPETGTGFLMTPLGNYAGDMTVTFRARLLPSEEGTDQMAVMIVSSEVGILEEQRITIEKDWKTYTLKFSKGEFKDCAIELFMQSKRVQVDDIKATSVQTSIIPPEVLDATDFTGSSFTANWAKTDEAESYLFSLYKKGTKEATVTQNFETIKATADGKLDKANSVIPEGWQIAPDHGNSKKEVAAEGMEGSTAIVFDETNDFVTIPYSEKPIRDLRLFIKNLNAVPCLSRLVVQVLEGEGEDAKWFILGGMDIERISAEGEIISLTNKLEYNVHQVTFAFEKNDKDAALDLAIAIGNISYMTEPINTPVIEDKETTDTFYKVAQLDSNSDYCYTVKAKNTTFTSAPSREKLVLNLSAPVLEKATVGADKKSYTARWQAVPKADGYYVRNFKVKTLPEAQESVLLEEDFSKVTSGTLEAPSGMYNVTAGLLDQYDLTKQPGWMGQCNYQVAGMLGAYGSFFGKGLLQTPTMKLDGNGGKFKVEITAYGGLGSDGDQLVVQAGPEVFQRFDISEYKSTKITAEFDCGTADMALLLYSYKGAYFFIDDIKVTQTLPAGTQIITEVGNATVWGNGNTSYVFDNLEQGEYEQYGFRVYAHRWYRGQELYSLSDEMALVNLNEQDAGVDTVGNGTKIFAAGNRLHVVLSEAAAVRVYDAFGRCIIESQASEGTNVYSINRSGIYLVNAGNRTVKVIIR